jgi:hypothetical protein
MLFEDGLPLGLVRSSSRFTDVFYFFSPAFRAGMKFRASLRRRCFLLGIIFLSGLIATFAGPSAALLLIPVVHPSWPGGGTPFYIIGTNDTLWPSYLDADHVGGPECLSPSADMLNSDDFNTSACIWHGYLPLSRVYIDAHLSKNPTIIINDGISNRMLSITLSTDVNAEVETWTTSTYIASGYYSRQIAPQWWDAALVTTVQKYDRIKFSTKGSSVASVQTPIPAVRVQCGVYGSSLFVHEMEARFEVNLAS